MAHWRTQLVLQLISLLLLCLIAGFLTEAYAVCLLIGLIGLLIWHFRQLIRLLTWLKNSDSNAEPPHSSNLWGEVFDQLYRMQQRDQRIRSGLQSVIARVQESTAALTDAVIMLDKHGQLSWWNKAAETLLGFKKPQDLHQLASNLIRHPEFKDFFYRKRHNDTFVLPSPINEQMLLQFHLTVYGNSEHLLLVRDITRIHQLEQMRKDFVANVSHELRTPLTVISGYLETLLDNADENLNPRWRRALQQMQQQGERMQHLVDDLLLLARLEATEHQTTGSLVELQPLLGKIVSDAQSLSEHQHQFRLEVQPSLVLEGNKNELRSAFSNLIFNAVKYTPTAGSISITAWSDQRGTHVSVNDTGVGIDKKHLPRLTERFYRVDSSRASYSGGTGLGLAIVKHVLLRHQGRLQITSEPGVGSTFTCHFNHSATLPQPSNLS